MKMYTFYGIGPVTGHQFAMAALFALGMIVVGLAIDVMKYGS